MASHTIELSFLLRGFSDINDDPYAFISPYEMIERTKEKFFAAIGGISIGVWGDERDEILKQEFQKSFLEYFYMKEIGFQTPTAFYLELGNFLRRKLPIYTTHWKYILDEMYLTSTANSVGNTSSKNDNKVQSLSNSSGTTTTTAANNSDATTLSGQADTPQNELDLDLNNMKFASQVGKTNAKNKADSNGQSESSSETSDQTTNAGTASGESVSSHESRNKDVFDIYSQWISSGFDLFTPIFEEIMREQIFHILL